MLRTLGYYNCHQVSGNRGLTSRVAEGFGNLVTGKHIEAKVFYTVSVSISMSVGLRLVRTVSLLFSCCLKETPRASLILSLLELQFSKMSHNV